MKMGTEPHLCRVTIPCPVSPGGLWAARRNKVEND